MTVVRYCVPMLGTVLNYFYTAMEYENVTLTLHILILLDIQIIYYDIDVYKIYIWILVSFLSHDEKIRSVRSAIEIIDSLPPDNLETQMSACLQKNQTTGSNNDLYLNQRIFWIGRGRQYSLSLTLQWMPHTRIKPKTLVLLAPCSNKVS